MAIGGLSPSDRSDHLGYYRSKIRADSSERALMHASFRSNPWEQAAMVSSGNSKRASGPLGSGCRFAEQVKLARLWRNCVPPGNSHPGEMDSARFAFLRHVADHFLQGTDVDGLGEVRHEPGFDRTSFIGRATIAG